MAASSSADAKGQWLMTLIGRLGEWRFLTVSVALHFVLFLTFGSVVLVKQAPRRATFESVSGSFVVPLPTGAPDALPSSTQPGDAGDAAVTGISAPSQPTVSPVPRPSPRPARR